MKKFSWDDVVHRIKTLREQRAHGPVAEEVRQLNDEVGASNPQTLPTAGEATGLGLVLVVLAGLLVILELVFFDGVAVWVIAFVGTVLLAVLGVWAYLRAGKGAKYREYKRELGLLVDDAVATAGPQLREARTLATTPDQLVVVLAKAEEASSGR